jgi:hypothetical protein
MKLLVAFCLCGLSLSLCAQQNALSWMSPVESQPRAHFITSGDWPLKWISQTFTEEDQLKEVVLQNVSNRTVVGFQLGWAVFIPEGCGVTEAGVPRSETHVAPYESRRVSAGETVTIGPYHLSSESIAALASHAHSPAVVAQIGLYRVRYSDGGETISAFEQMGAFGPEASTYPCQSREREGAAEKSTTVTTDEELELEAKDANTLHTFVSPDGVFQFRYTELLVHCTESKKQAGWWEPQESCEAYFPVCDEADQGSVTLVCFAYPREKFKDSPTFEAATFSVAEIKQATSEKGCLGGSPDWVVYPQGSDRTEIVNGVKFKVFEVSDAGMSQGLGGLVYRSFHENKCYQLNIRTAMASSGAFDPGTIREFTKEDWNEVHGRLKQSLDSFKFLK